MTYRAILFDFGGVIGTSPFDAFIAYERERGLPHGFIASLNTFDPDNNAWARMERGELDADAFYARFEDEARARGGVFDGRGAPPAGSAAEGQRGVFDGRGAPPAGSAAEGQRGVFDARQLFARLAVRVRPEMIAAVRALRERYIVACVSNNMHLGHGLAMSATPEIAAEIDASLAHFHHVFESRVLGMRKPEPRIYEHVHRALGVAPSECIFLDDLGLNLKPARALGMATIKVGEPAAALAELARLLGHPV